MQFRTVLRRAAAAMTMAVAAGAVAVSLAASPAGAHHEICRNEPVPGDVWTSHTAAGITVFAGADTGLNNVPLGSARVCLAVGGTAVANTHYAAGVIATDADPGRIGIQEQAYVCIGAMPCLTVLGPTGAEVGFPSGYTGPNIVCVGSQCVTAYTLDPNSDLYVHGMVIPVPCLRIGPGAPACP